MALCIKLIDNRVGSFEINFVRGATNIILNLFYSQALGIPARKLWGNRDSMALLTMRGLFGAVAACGGYLCVTMLQLGDANVLIFTSPVFTALFAWVLLGERMSRVDCACLVLAFLGVVLILRPPFLFGTGIDSPLLSRPWGVVAGLSSAVLQVCLRFSS
jgi:drug/metabolite transporter (DMT)-like permease